MYEFYRINSQVYERKWLSSRVICNIYKMKETWSVSTIAPPYTMKRHINPLIVLYIATVFIPTAVITTVACAALTCLMIPVCGDSKWGYYPGLVWAKILCTTALVKVDVEGRGNIDPQSSYVFAANHQSIFDIFLVYGWLGVKFRWIMKKELRRVPIIGKTCEMMGHIFIDRTNARAAKRSLEAAEKRLKGGKCSIVMFPEGTRTRDGKVGRFKRGALVIARDLQLPVVPVSIIGAYDVMPYHAWYIKPGTIRMTIHPPVMTAGISDTELHTTTDRIRNTVASAIENQ